MQVTIENLGLLAVYRVITSLLPYPQIPLAGITYELDPEHVREHIAEAVLNMSEEELKTFCEFVLSITETKSVQVPAQPKE